MEEKILMYKIRPKGNGFDWCVDHPGNLLSYLSMPDEEWEINTIEITKKEMDQLDEFQGW